MVGRAPGCDQRDFDDRDVDPTVAARYRCLARSRPLSPEESEAFWTAVFGPRAAGASFYVPRRPLPVLPLPGARHVANAEEHAEDMVSGMMLR